MKLLLLILPLLFATPVFAQSEAECEAKVEYIINNQSPPSDYKNWDRIPATMASTILLIYDSIKGEKYLGTTPGSINMGTDSRPNIKYITVYLVYFHKKEKRIE